MIREFKLTQDQNYNWFWEEVSVTAVNGPFTTYADMIENRNKWIGDGA